MSISPLFRWPNSVNHFNDIIKAIDARLAPLYSSPAIQAPMINAESQWQERYTLTLSLQAHITVSFQQDYFDKAEISTEQVDNRP
ncbi:phage neck terminator protein [Escherichia coli]|uniref:phage neck terminator protein n=1 Tax=Escherichia coli TaxID=562 RepID=UPI00098CC92B